MEGGRLHFPHGVRCMLQYVRGETHHIQPLTTRALSTHSGEIRGDHRKNAEPAEPFGLQATDFDKDGQEEPDNV